MSDHGAGPVFGMRHHPSTPEGEIEGAERFARGLRHVSWRRWVGIGVVVAMVLPVLVFVYGAVFDR